MKIKKIAMPQEHGSWEFFFEPLILSLIIAYSYQGLMLFLASSFIFLSHQPIRILFDKKINKGDKRKALVFAVIYISIELIALWQSIAGAELKHFFPFFIAIVLMASFLTVEINTPKESFLARLIPPLAVDLIAVSIVRLGGMKIPETIAFYFVLLGRSALTAFYIKEKLNKLKQQYLNSAYIFLLHSLYLIILVFLSIGELTPFTTIIAAIILLGRAVLGLRSNGKSNVRSIGIWEVIHGVIFVIVVSVGYLNNW